MEAKDTVMSPKEFAIVKYPILKSAQKVNWEDYLKPLDKLALERQAEISFKAGYEEGEAKAYHISHRAGMKKVVE